MVTAIGSNGAFTEAFKKASLILPPLETEQQVIDNAFLLHKCVKTWLETNKFDDAVIALDLLMSHKAPLNPLTHEIIPEKMKMRRNGITPDFIHELAQVISVIADYEAGLLSQEHLQPAIVTALIHDLGEDFSLLPNDVLKIFENSNNAIDHVRRMEIMTFDRAYSPEQILQEIGENPNIIITKTHLEKLQEKIEEGSTCLQRYNLGSIKFSPTPSEKGKYRFSRYMYDEIVDWNLYVSALLSDQYTAYGKIKDRNDGLGTRIGTNFDIANYNRYLTQTYNNFSVYNMGRQASKAFPELQDAIEANDHMMFLLHRIGRIYIQNHPDNNTPGRKGQNAFTMRFPDFQARVSSALMGYQYTPSGINPLYTILNRMKNGNAINGPTLHQVIIEALQQDIYDSKIETLRHQHAPFIAKLQQQ